MAVQASWGSTNNLRINSAAGATMPYLDHTWVYSTVDIVGTALVSGASTSTANESRAVCSRSVNPTWGGRITDSGGIALNAEPTNTLTNSQWNSVAVAFIADNRTEGWVNGDTANKAVNTTTRVGGTAAFTQVGAMLDGTFSSTSGNYAEESRWDITGFSEADRNALIVRLNTLVGGKVIDPRTANADSGEPWSNRLLRYWTLKDNSIDGREDKMGSGNDFTINGTVNTSGVAHPDVAVFGAGVARLIPSLPALYNGAILLASRTGIQFVITDGHTGIDGLELAAGVSGTTNASGIFILPEAITIDAEADDPITVKLWWTEGSDPELTHSVVHKTTLVAEE